MTTSGPSGAPPADGDARGDLAPAAKRALAEAEARRRASGVDASKAPPEKGGPAGAEPTRYGDWERKGRAIDF